MLLHKKNILCYDFNNTFFMEIGSALIFKPIFVHL